MPITYAADRAKAEEIMLEATRKHAVNPDSVAAEAKRDLQERFGVEPLELAPRVFYRITDNWLELTVRFVVRTHQIRGVKDAISRDMLIGLDAVGIGIASSTYDIVGLPPLELRRGKAAGRVA